MDKAPRILVVDSSKVAAAALASIFTKQGLTNIATAASAAEALALLGADRPVAPENWAEFDLILFDIMMPDMDGIQACGIIKGVERLRDVPVIMTTGRTDFEALRRAFAAGAMDYLTKPINEVELMARVTSALALKAEIDERKAREKQLLELTERLSAANRELRRLSSLDGLTGLANRRLFDAALEREWRRALRQQTQLAIVMMDIDHFKLYNDHYGHLAGDDCLKQVAGALQTCLRRPGDLLARYGGEEFVALLADTDQAGAMLLANYARQAVENLGLPHAKSPVAKVVTVSLGVAATAPQKGLPAAGLVEAADQALYRAKKRGRNQVVAGSFV
jgi:two-component system chemotaxis family response regulator WspR